MKRFSIVNNGYNIDEVNNFIDVVIKKLEKLSQENSDYLIQLEKLKKENNQNLELKISKALIAAQETTDKMKELAKVEAELIVKEAKDNASAIIQEALINAEKTEQDYQLLKKKYNVYKSRVESLVKAQLELLEEDLKDEEL